MGYCLFIIALQLNLFMKKGSQVALILNGILVALLTLLWNDLLDVWEANKFTQFAVALQPNFHRKVSLKNDKLVKKYVNLV